MIATHFDISGQPNGDQDALWKIAGFGDFHLRRDQHHVSVSAHLQLHVADNREHARGEYMLARKFLRLLEIREPEHTLSDYVDCNSGGEFEQQICRYNEADISHSRDAHQLRDLHEAGIQ